MKKWSLMGKFYPNLSPIVSETNILLRAIIRAISGLFS
jgi:hypothetical protein